ncbi:hypothetical protein J2847_004106 [Azospirillum agricola]|uniref:hypothetical protein n=1 Tax=Azospirillum agricola TaxID=1720247 RepID=UPI001AE1C270|nr:hypothetical protein [Azospirillum agricola]MBP2230797.1 hypothetical protein [Azospirillum agricola]
MTGLVLDARSLTLPTLRLGAPAIIRSRGEPPPLPPAEVTVTIHRQPLAVAADAQVAVLDHWRAHRLEPSPTMGSDLREAGLLHHCGFLSADPGGPLIFRRIADATVKALGREWARQQLGKPNDDDPYSEYAIQLATHYDEAIQGGEPVYNHLVIHGLAHPVVYSHLLVGWTSPTGQQALLTVIDWPGV